MSKNTKYGGLGEPGRIYKNPGMFLGNDSPDPRNETGINIEDGKPVLCTLSNYETPEAVLCLFQEIITNAADNGQRSREEDVDPGPIEVMMTSKTVSVTNYGLPLPVVQKIRIQNGQEIILEDYNPKKHKDKEPIWLPKFIFGKLGTSSNYDESKARTGAGINGIGAKILNVFSKLFVVESWDASRNLYYRGVWKDNMFMNTGEEPEETIAEMDLEKSKVTITWDLDFARFEMEEYNDMDIMLFARCTADFSFTCKIQTVFNDIKFDFQRITDFAKMIIGEDHYLEANKFTHFDWSDKKTKKKLLKLDESDLIEAVSFPESIKEFPKMEIMVIDTPGIGESYGYGNGIYNCVGGTHVKGALEPLAKFLCDLFNGDKKSDKKPGEKKKKNKNDIKPLHVQKHLTIIINVHVENPKFPSQNKNKLGAPKITVNIPDNKLESMKSWKIMECLEVELRSINLIAASVHDGKKTKYVSGKVGQDANKAGPDKEAADCTLYIVEGKSAATYITSRISYMEGNNDYYGFIPIRGKFLNVTKASNKKYENNTEVRLIKQFMGLREGVDYSIESNLNTLRYGRIEFVTDADDDGMHIMAILINFIREKFPGLLDSGRVEYLKTPLVRIVTSSGKVLENFFSREDYKKYVTETGMPKGAHAVYFKGLGSSDDDEAGLDVKIAPEILFTQDEDTIASLDIAFHPDNVRERKKWIRDFRPNEDEDIDEVLNAKSDVVFSRKLKGHQLISSFINKELIRYTISALYRAIPSYYDGLKKSQRQILYAMLEYSNYKKTPNFTKVPILTGMVIEKTHYVNGNTSLDATMVNLARTYTGSNNLNYLSPKGGYGNNSSHTSAAPRYLFSGVPGWLPLIYTKESIDIVEKVIEEDHECEPAWLPGVIPMGIVNGFLGVATGHSTSCEPHNPFDVINWFRSRCKGETPEPILPWYRDFGGRIEIVKKSDSYDEGNELFEIKDNSDDSEEESEEDEEENESLALLKSARKSKLSCLTYGRFSVSQERKGQIVTIEELPPRVSYEKYDQWLRTEALKTNKDRMIKDYTKNFSRAKGKKDKMKIVIKWNKDYPKDPSFSELKLVKRFGISNLILINKQGIPKKFSGVNMLMEQYFIVMRDHYRKVRNNREKAIIDNIKTKKMKRKFIKLVNEGKIVLKATMEAINAQLVKYNIPEKYHKDVKCHELEVSTVEKLDKLIESLETDLRNYANVTWRDIWVDKLDELEKHLRKNWKVSSQE